MGPPGAPFSYFFIIHPRKKFLNQNDIEFDFSLGHALVLSPFFFNNKQKCTGDHVCPSRPPQNSYISIYSEHKT